MTVGAVTRSMKNLHEASIRATGKTASRSGGAIKVLHRYVAERFDALGVPAGQILLERTLPTWFGRKDQDVTVLPHGYGRATPFDDPFAAPRTISVSLCSSMTSVEKNFDNMHNKAYSDAGKMHELHREQVAGHVQFVVVNQFLTSNGPMPEPVYQPVNNVAEQLKQLQELGGRTGVHDVPGRFERLALVVVDLQPAYPVLYSTTQELIDAGVVTAEDAQECGLAIENYHLSTFVDDLVEKFMGRFGLGVLTPGL